MAKDAIHEGTREVRTFVDLNHGAEVMIRKSEEELKGSYYTTMSALLLTAFTFEAYLNHLGDKTFKFWKEIESVNVMGKYSALCQHYSITPAFSRRPYQTLGTLFKFRNAIAHGKSQILQETKHVSSLDSPFDLSPIAHWEEYSVLENAKRAKQDVSLLIIELHKAAGLGERPFVHGIGSSRLSPIGKPVQ
jgi:hypothetical protein